MQDAKPDRNKGVKKDAKKWVQQRKQKWMFKNMKQKTQQMSFYKKCTIAPILVPNCSSQLRKNYTKIWR